MSIRGRSIGVVAVALACGVTLTVVLTKSQGQTQEAGAEFEVIEITEPIENPELDRDIRPPSEAPSITASEAFTIAEGKIVGEKPAKILVALVQWNGELVWVVSFQGGTICPPIMGYPGSEIAGQCSGNAINVRIDAKSGLWLNTFSDGAPVPVDRVGDEPLRTMEQLLEGSDVQKA